MSEAAFTQGPYYVSGYSDKEGHHLHIGTKHSTTTLASLNEYHPDAIANAALFSASTDLYEALVNARALWGHRSTDAPQLKWLASVDAALAKAHGETP